MKQKPVQQNKLNIQLRPASIEEAGLFYSQMEEGEDHSLGTVGHLRIDFGHRGQEFWSSWWEHNGDHFNTPEFREELQMVVDELRRSGPLKDLKTMRSYGKWTIIDHDYFWPHNIARHVLTSNDIGYYKVESLEKVANHIQSDSDLVAIASDVFGKDNSVSMAFGQSDIILDSSASIAVERYLALDVQSDARRISCFLNPQGTATIMLLESADRTARLDLLEMQYYRELLKNEKYSDHMSLPETMIYSGTCRSISSRISQDNVSLSAALCCKAIKLHTSNADGKIIIWTHASDSVEKESFMAEKWITREYNGWQVELSLSLLNEMQTDRRSALPNETGGVLIGAYDIARKRVYVVCQVKAPDDSISSPTSFIRGCANLPERLEYIYKTTLDNLTYIGEWHSHPSANTQKSMDDEKLHKAIVDYNRENCLPGCMMILGTDNFSIYLNE